MRADVKTPAVVGSGLLALDIVISEVSGAPTGYWAGGTCGNVLIALRYFGWESQPVARLRSGAAANRILEDLHRWGVSNRFVSTADDGSTPVIVERIIKGSGNVPRHSFSWRCPECGSQFPAFKPVLATVAEEIATMAAGAQVYFFDRATPGGIVLAKACAENGALVVFEPSSIGNQILFRQAWETAHIVKYSHERLRELPEVNVAHSPLLQIETLGEAGLRYRKVPRTGRGGEWIEIGAFKVDVVRDTAGSGDWCTAGIIECCGRSGADGFANLKQDELESAIRYGQALAAWNCGFEGARGGMYAVDRETFLQQVGHILEGGSDLPNGTLEFRGRDKAFVGGLCPACKEADNGKSVTGTDGSTSH
ncbi:MAG: PfkB family carbohydrate kinase [Isosphaeraceae bacterium]|nr:PfkB family carbohydrate kinase [Isosphaeraceae bacterium]